MKLLRRLFLLLLVLVLIGGVVAWTLPADLALRWLKPNLGPLQLSGVSGTVWQGRASTAVAFGLWMALKRLPAPPASWRTSCGRSGWTRSTPVSPARAWWA